MVMETHTRSKKKRMGRIVRGLWPDQKIRKLIAIVKCRPELWKINCVNYRIHRPYAWQKVAAELGDNADWLGCRAKWQNLRVTYNSNLIKMEKRKWDHGCSEGASVPWRFFDAMSFISTDENRISKDTLFDPSVNKKAAFDASSTVEENSDISETVHSPSFIETSALTPVSPTPVSQDRISNNYDSQEQTTRPSRDEHSIFGEYIASELRRLPDHHSFNLKRRLNRTLVDFWDDISEQAEPAIFPKLEPLT